jgi:TolA-binding protein
VPAPSASAADGETAATLFARANAARRRGDRDEALRLYRRLQERFPASDEARLSHATMGKLVLEGEPDAALAEFDRYLGAAKGGALGEEALVGRAVALGRLGRHAEEKAAWQELLARHPRSVHAARARARIAELAAK